MSFSTPSRASSAKKRRRSFASGVRRFVPELIAAAGALLLAVAVHYGLEWKLLASGAVGLIVAVVGLVIYRLTIRAAEDAREADSATLRMRRLYELTRCTLEMDLNQEPGARLASVVHAIFELDAVAIFDADLQEVYSAGRWKLDPLELVQNVYHFGTSDDDRNQRHDGHLLAFARERRREQQYDERGHHDHGDRHRVDEVVDRQ